MKIHGVRFEHLPEPLGIGTGTPRISWQISDPPTGWQQTGYDLEVHGLAVEQAALGTVPVYVPYVPLVFPALPFAVWGDAAVTVPWDLHRTVGDRDLLRQQYPSMLAWVQEVERRAGPSRLWTDDLQLGDWLEPSAPTDQPAKAMTDPDLVATAYFAHSAELLAGRAGHPPPQRALPAPEDDLPRPAHVDKVAAALAGRDRSQDSP
jgi:hypothetical protein